MQRLTTLIIFTCLFSCSDNVDQFVQNDVSIVHTQLKDIGQSKSSSFKLNNNTVSNIATDNNTEIELPINTFFKPSELSDIPFQLDIIELDSYEDYITSNVTNLSDEGVRDVVFSIYISAKDNEKNTLSVQNNQEIVVRIPAENKIGELQLGSGYASENVITWNYSNTQNNKKIKYKQWSRTNSENVLEEFSGYEFSISESGWYSLTVVKDDQYSLNDVCLSIPEEKFNENNSLVFILLDSHQHLLQAQPLNSEIFCNYNVPVTGNTLDIIAISYIDGEDQFYYDSKQIKADDIDSEINLSPVRIDKETLSSKLMEL